MDSALDDFLSRFGDPDPNKSMVQNLLPKVSEFTGNSSDWHTGNSGIDHATRKQETILNTNGLAKGVQLSQNISEEKMSILTEGKIDSLNQEGDSFGEKASKGLSKAVELLPVGMNTANSLSGNAWDTSAEGGGPGKVGPKLMGDAAGAFEAGNSIAGPWAGAGLAAVSIGANLIGHNKAKKEYNENVIASNQEKDAYDLMKSREAFMMEQGLASRNLLKSLREKQLGMLS